MGRVSELISRILGKLKNVLGELTFWKALKAYGCFALVHTTFKVLGLYMKVKNTMAKLKNIPGNPIDWTSKDFLENVHRHHEWVRDYIHEFDGNGKHALVKSPAADVEIFCTKPEAVQTILKTEFKSATKPGPDQDYGFKLLGEWLGNEGIFVLRHGANLPKEDTQWYAQRKTASKLFTKSNFNNLMYDTLMKKSDCVIKALDKIAAQNEGITSNDPQNGAKVVDMQEIFFCFTFDSISKIFFNRDVDSIGGRQDPFAQAFDNAHREMMLHLVSATGMYVFTHCILPFPFGSWTNSGTSLNPLFSLYRHHEPHYIKFKEHIATLDKFTYEAVDIALSQEHSLSKRKDLLAFFLQGNHQLSRKQLRDIILNFIIAGRDTTACTLTWLLFELTQNLEQQEKLAQEVLNAFGPDGKPTMETTEPEQMPYLTGAILEALRLHPPVPEDSKYSQRDVTFPDGTTVPKGVKLTFVPYTMGRDPSRYEDPLSFKPERWQGKEKYDVYQFPVFQGGARKCLGDLFAMNEMRLLVCRLMQRFSFQLSSEINPQDVTYALMVTMSLCVRKNGKPHTPDPNFDFHKLDENTTHNLWIVPRRRFPSSPM